MPFSNQGMPAAIPAYRYLPLFAQQVMPLQHQQARRFSTAGKVLNRRVTPALLAPVMCRTCPCTPVMSFRLTPAQLCQHGGCDQHDPFFRSMETPGIIVRVFTNHRSSGNTQARSITQRRRRQQRPTTTSGSNTDDSILQKELIRTRENQHRVHHHRTRNEAAPDTSEFIVIPWLPERSCTNLAGGNGSICVWIGQLPSYISSSGITEARSRLAFQ